MCDDKPAGVITAAALICFHIRVTVKADLSSLPTGAFFKKQQSGVITANKTGLDIIFSLLKMWILEAEKLEMRVFSSY